MAISPAIAHHRAKVARRKQSYPEGHPKVVEAQQDLAYAGLTEHAAKVVADWPTPPTEVLDRIAAILRGGARQASAC